ncbi:serine hydrolase domain-containing protein [Paraflavitalea pollutisoli]|uniref:serine hydrolase domain-containing protein n=1 Tax=Paraflavitalea pollutisoli TaxID=3034143 RepID=UPI0023ECCB46|nr:serine hydrolase domain-containing protein [Paraflavitalea sp. H1-2-19X]
MKLIATLLLLCASIVASAQTPAPIRDKSYKKAIEAARRFIDSLRQSQHLPGLSVAVGNRDKILWAEGFGYADLENQVPVNIHSNFRMGSVSKVITTLAVGRLYQQGMLDLDAPVQQYLPAFPAKPYPITARQLAGHLAGIRHYGPNDPTNVPKRYKSVQESLSIFSSDSLLFKPGTNYNYSTYGYSLLSAVVESAARKDFLSYLRDSIWQPLGMLHTAPDYSDSIIAGRVRFYEVLKDGTAINAAQVDNSYKWAGGGLLSTPSDLVLMVQGLLQHRLLDAPTLQLLFTSQQLENGKKTNVGIGWRINETREGVRYIHHGGLIDGGRTFLLFFPDSGLIFAVASNTHNAQLNINEAMKVLAMF